MRRLSIVALLLVAIVATPATQALSAPQSGGAPVIKLKTKQFGPILGTPKRLALYYWNAEKNGKVRCIGVCAKEWPPLYVAKGKAVPRRIAGIAGTFGKVRRSDGRLQITHNGRPLYTYYHDTPTLILCDNVDGWFVIRLPR